MGVIFFIYFQLLLYSTDSRMYFFITWRRPQSNPLPSPAIRISDIKWLVKAIELCKRNTNPKANDPADLIWTQKCSDKTKTVSGHTDVRNEQLRLWKLFSAVLMPKWLFCWWSWKFIRIFGSSGTQEPAVSGVSTKNHRHRSWAFYSEKDPYHIISAYPRIEALCSPCLSA